MTSQGIRLTNMLYNHGPGSILETVQGPVVVQGWDKMIDLITSEQNKSSGLQLSKGEWLNKLQITEPRLSYQLIQHNTTGLVKLHAIPSNQSLEINTRKALIRTVDFPEYHLCRKGKKHPKDSILFKWTDDRNAPRCPVCSTSDRISPIRFASACNAGHLDDLPWHFMVHKKGDNCKGYVYNWREENTSTSGITIECREKGCGKSIQLNQGVGKLGLIPCSRNDPSGVMEKVDTCDRSVNLVLRSSTSVWQSESLTAITIPDDEIKLCLAKMEKCHPPGKFNRIEVIQTINPPKQLPAAGDPCVYPVWNDDKMDDDLVPCPFAQESHRRQDRKSWIFAHILQWHAGRLNQHDFDRYVDPIRKKIDEGSLSPDKFREEWDKYNQPTRISVVDALEAEYRSLFETDTKVWPETKPHLFIRKKVLDQNQNEIRFGFGKGSNKIHLRADRITKLRTVTALKGFRRPVRDANGNPANLVPLSHRAESGTDWFAAVEAQGEGILLTFDADSTLFGSGDRWKKWASKFNSNLNLEPEKRHMFRGLRGEPLDLPIEEKHIAESHPMFVWWHTLAHHLIRTIQQDTGYSSSAITERIYAHEIDGKWTGGILLYVTEGGMDGTLGGLTSLAPNLQRYLDTIAEESDNCSNDPLCRDTTSSSLEHDRACYACTYNSETSCGHRNMFLDRLLLRECVGL